MSHAQPFTSDLPDWKPGLRSQVKVGGRFLLLDEVGQGSAAVVYKARDTWTDGLVALKVLRGSAAVHPRIAAGFRRECEIASQLTHPNVVRFVASGVQDGWTYLTMEFVGGRTLAELLRFHPHMPMPEFEALCRHLLSALRAVHEAGIVHRDVKPSNLMLGADGQWKLMDFGIARPADGAVTAGPALGTPQYMSPEQLLGDQATPLSDLYSAGMVFHEALTGQLPLAQASVRDRCTLPPPRVSERRPGVPPWLDELVFRCLAVNPRSRLGSAAEAEAALGVFVEAPVPEPVPAPVAAAPAQPRTAELPLLRDYLTDAPGKTEDVLAMFLELLRALQQRELRHETIDPLTPDSVHRSPAGRIEIRGHQRTGARDTAVVANPKYAAPELLHGEAQPAGAARTPVHLYSVGLMMYEFLLGRQRFRREFAGMEEPGSGLAWMEWHTDATKRARPLAEALPAATVASEIVAGMMEKDPARRCATYEEAIGKLQALVNRTKVTQELPVPALAGRGAAKRFRPAIIALVTALVLAAVLAALVFYLR